MGSLVQQREELERRVDDLRAFEREYRSRLKAYLEGQLRDLEAGATDSGAFPVMGSGQQPVGAALQHADVRNGQQQAGTASFPTSADAPQHSGGYRPAEAPAPHERR